MFSFVLLLWCFTAVVSLTLVPPASICNKKRSETKIQWQFKTVVEKFLPLFSGLKEEEDEWWRYRRCSFSWGLRYPAKTTIYFNFWQLSLIQSRTPHCSMGQSVNETKRRHLEKVSHQCASPFSPFSLFNGRFPSLSMQAPNKRRKKKLVKTAFVVAVSCTPTRLHNAHLFLTGSFLPSCHFFWCSRTKQQQVAVIVSVRLVAKCQGMKGQRQPFVTGRRTCPSL